jgi:hypothetical protein
VIRRGRPLRQSSGVKGLRMQKQQLQKALHAAVIYLGRDDGIVDE